MELPNEKIGEITLIGTGGGYGESIVVHIGNNNWVVIDSCINPTTKTSLPLEYLRRIGVDATTQVKMVICTHWHDDHILGISQLLKACTNAKFCIAHANDRKKFLQFVTLDYKKVDVQVSNSSTIEFNSCIKIIEERGQSITLASSDKTLLSFTLSSNLKGEVLSLSPSDYTILQFDKEISTLITQYGSPAKKVIVKSPNSKSVAIFLKLGEHRAILGADLEETNDDREGWSCIVNNSQVVDKPSTFFKIPHHGSENGYCQSLWSMLIDKEPIAALTPWNKKKKLPTVEMLKKYHNHTRELYMTSAVFSDKPKKRNKRIEKVMKDLRCRVSEVKYQQGIVRCRINLLDPTDKWEVEILENAQKIAF